MIGLPQLAVASPLSYLLAFLVPALDAVLPILPSETVVIALGVATSGSVDPRIGILIALAAAGAFTGDNLCYFIGRRFGPAAERWVFAGDRGQKRRDWATGALQRYGAGIIIVCRFIPGGRTAVTFICGAVAYPRRSFIIATACAGSIWAVYAFLLGRLGGQAFEHQPWLGLVIAFGATLVVTAMIEGMRRLRPWRWFTRPRPGPAAHPDGDPDPDPDRDLRAEGELGPDTGPGPRAGPRSR
ncbi:MAG TPA: DedA family protein [Streptosporangiaceae bacterium]